MKKLIVVVLALLLSVGIFGGCSGGEQKIVISGDQEAAEIVEKLAYVYSKKTGITIDVNATGSAQGFKDVLEGISDIGLMARKPQGDEAKQVLVSGRAIAREGIVVIVNKDFKDEYLPLSFSKVAISWLFRLDAEGGNWWEALKKSNALGYPPSVGIEGKPPHEVYFEGLQLVPVNRPQSSGLREAFDETAGLRQGFNDGKEWPNYESKNTVIASSEFDAVELVKKTPGAIAYVRYSTYESYKDEVKALAINNKNSKDTARVYPTFDNIVTKDYPFQRYFRYFINKDGVNQMTQDFLDWLKSDEAYSITEIYKYIVDQEAPVEEV